MFAAGGSMARWRGERGGAERSESRTATRREMVPDTFSLASSGDLSRRRVFNESGKLHIFDARADAVDFGDPINHLRRVKLPCSVF